MSLSRDQETKGTIQGFAPSQFFTVAAGGQTFNVAGGTIWRPASDITFDYGGGEAYPIGGGTILVIPHGVTTLVIHDATQVAFAGVASI